jgi:hypothetical protein
MGKCFISINGDKVFQSESIERGDNDNQARISCIPTGTYLMVLEYSSRFKRELWEIKDVPNRSECKFHSANYSRELNGCVALGVNRADIDKDGNKDVTNSKATMARFHKVLEGYKTAQLNVINI